LKEASISENAPFQSQRHATKFAVWGGEKCKPTLTPKARGEPLSFWRETS
jgi:hypothetical protein